MSQFGTKKGKYRHVLKALTGEYPIVEADEPITIEVLPEHVASAIPHDPRNCAIAEACRANGALEAVIGASVAYVVTEMEPGQLVAMKYTVPNGTRRAIDRFDISGVMPKKGFKLSAVEGSRRIGARKDRRRRLTGTQKHTSRVAKLDLRTATDVIRLKV